MHGTHLRPRTVVVVEHEGEPPQEVRLVSTDPTFAHRLATPAVRRATLEGNLMHWRTNGRDLSVARQTPRGDTFPTERTMRTAHCLVALAQALPTDVLQ